MNPFQTLGHSVTASSAHGLVLVLCEATNPLPILLSTLLILLQTSRDFLSFPALGIWKQQGFTLCKGKRENWPGFLCKACSFVGKGKTTKMLSCTREGDK